jgi:signal transduction histidine kinase
VEKKMTEKNIRYFKNQINMIREMFRRGSKDEASVALVTLKDQVKDLDNPNIICDIMILEGHTAYLNLDLGEALDIFFKALDYASKEGLTRTKANILNYIGVCYSALGLREKSQKYFEESIEIFEDNYVMCNLADRFLDSGQTEKGLKLIDRIISNSSEEEKPAELSSVLVSVADHFLENGEPEKAKKYYEKGLIYCKKADNIRKENFANIGLGKYYLQKDEFEKSYKYLKKAVDSAEETQLQELLWFSNEGILEYYEKLEDYKNLYLCYKKKFELHEKISASGIKNKIASLETAYALENKRLEAEKMIEKSSKLVSIGVMAAGITHEINQPLNSIAVNADGILFTNEHENVLTPFYIEAVNQIYDATQKISEIIKHMREFWSPTDYLEKQQFDANTTIINALRLVNKKVELHNIDLRKDFCSDSSIIIGNKVHLEQIIINLIVNAIQALDSSSVKSKQINITTRKKDKFEILISDNGTGISNEKADLFSPFYSTKGENTNMGLGLSIVQQFVKSMQGTIEYFNNDEGGASFEIKLPIKK